MVRNLLNEYKYCGWGACTGVLLIVDIEGKRGRSGDADGCSELRCLIVWVSGQTLCSRIWRSFQRKNLKLNTESSQQIREAHEAELYVRRRKNWLEREEIPLTVLHYLGEAEVTGQWQFSLPQ